MALPNDGPLTLNQIHIEAGGGSGTAASLNDADIRGLINKTANTAMSFSEWYGASAEFVTSMTNGNTQGGSPGTYSGFAANGSYHGPGTQFYPQLGTMANRLDPIPPSNGVSQWEIALLAREQGFGNQEIIIGLKDSSNPDDIQNTPDFNFPWPAGNVVLATNSAFTTGVVTIPPSKWTTNVTPNTILSGCQVVWQFLSNIDAGETPDYYDYTDFFFNTGTVYVKIEPT